MVLNPRQRLVLEALGIGAIILLAAVLRMGWPGITEFKADEARLLSLALDMRQGSFAFRGISSSTGFPNFPMSVWLYAIPILFWPSAYAATLFTGLLNTLAVVGCYWMVRRYWGINAALAAALMFAVSPWAIIFSRKIWAQNLLPLIVMVWAISAALAFVEGKRWWLIVHIVALAIAIQAHLAAVALIPATLIFLLVFRRRVEWRMLLVGAALAILIAAPFLAYLAPHLSDSDSLLAADGGSGVSGLSAHALQFASMITLGNDIHSLAGPEQFGNYLAQLPPMWPVYLLWAVLIVAGIVLAIVAAGRDWKSPPSQVGFILLLWLAVPLLVFLWQWTPVYIHYFIALLPAPYMLAGIAVGRIMARAGRWAAGLGWLVLLGSAGVQVYASLALLMLVGSVATPGGFGTPLAVKQAAADRARELVSAGAEEVLIAGAGSSPKTDSFAAEFDALLFDVPRRFVDISAEALFPASDAVVVIDDRTEISPWSTSDLYLDAAASSEAIAARRGEGVLRLVSLPGNAAAEPDRPLESPVLLSNFVTLLGSDTPIMIDDTERLWQVHWRTADGPDRKTYHFFNHLLDTNGRRLAQVDAPAFPGIQWHQGDNVISRFVVPWPAAEAPPAAMRVGMYVFPELTAVPLLDEAANPYADALEIPLND